VLVIKCFCQRLGSGDGERKTLLTRQIAFDPLPASVLLNEFAALKRFAFIGIEGDWRRLCMLPGLALAGDLVSMTVL
jgi:hypothetical protein